LAEDFAEDWDEINHSRRHQSKGTPTLLPFALIIRCRGNPDPCYLLARFRPDPGTPDSNGGIISVTGVL
jgi:hypothetical protein